MPMRERVCGLVCVWNKVRLSTSKTRFFSVLWSHHMGPTLLKTLNFCGDFKLLFLVTLIDRFLFLFADSCNRRLGFWCQEIAEGKVLTSWIIYHSSLSLSLCLGFFSSDLIAKHFFGSWLFQLWKCYFLFAKQASLRGLKKLTGGYVVNGIVHFDCGFYKQDIALLRSQFSEQGIENKNSKRMKVNTQISTWLFFSTPLVFDLVIITNGWFFLFSDGSHEP